MAINAGRRRLLQAAACLLAPRPVGGLALERIPQVALLGAWRRNGRDCVGIWQPDAGSRSIEIPFRAHEVLVDRLRPQSAIAVARRPGEFLARLDLAGMELTTLRPIDAEYVASGHAVFSIDGRSLLVSESHVLTGAGTIGFYDANSLECRARHQTLGIGPHALLCEPEGTVLVANSGVLTLPQTGRTKLNTGHIDPSLVRLDTDGRMLGQWRLPDPNLSIRHLARCQDGTVGIALQAEHPDVSERVRAPLFAVFDGRLMQSADATSVPLGGYGGDIRCIETPAGPLFAVGCTHAGVIALWDAVGRMLGAYPLRGACALATGGDTLIAPSEHGEVGVLSVRGSFDWHIRDGAPEWDNHAIVWNPDDKSLDLH